MSTIEEIESTSGAKLQTSNPQMTEVLRELGGDAILGTTDAGQLWCLKALHPAQQNVQSCQCPTLENRQIVSTSYTQINNFSLPSSFDADKVWEMHIWVHRDPCILYSYTLKQAGKTEIRGYVSNTQVSKGDLGLDSYDNTFAFFRDSAERLRLTSHSITGYFDGASMTDQGHVVLCQTDLNRVELPSTYDAKDFIDHPDDMFQKLRGSLPFVYYQDPRCTYEQALQFPNFYQGPIAEGFYCPSKMTNPGSWIVTNDPKLMIGASNSTHTETETTSILNDIGKPPGGVYGANECGKFRWTFPFFIRDEPYHPKMVFDSHDPGITNIFIKGIAGTSTVRLTVRMTMDMIVRPGTSFAPFAKEPVGYDEPAIRMYYEISRRLKDGYPGSYNMLGSLLPLIGKAASFLAPIVIPNLTKYIREKFARHPDSDASLFAVKSKPLTPEETNEMNALGNNAGARTGLEDMRYYYLMGKNARASLPHGFIPDIGRVIQKGYKKYKSFGGFRGIKKRFVSRYRKRPYSRYRRRFFRRRY